MPPEDPHTKPIRPPSTRVSLSRPSVLDAAVLLADTHGIGSLSMRKLATALGVKAMSLYNHVTNKDDILLGMVDRVIGEIDAPEAGPDWQTAMRRRAVSAHDALLRHPWATQLLVSRIHVGPNMLRYVDATLGCLRQAGFSYALADQAWNAMDSYIYGYTLQKLNFPVAQRDFADTAVTHQPMAPPASFPYLAELTALVIAGEHTGGTNIRFGLDLLLDGLERQRTQG